MRGAVLALLGSAVGAVAVAPAGYKPIPGVLGYVGCFREDDSSQRQFNVARGQGGSGNGVFVKNCADKCSQYQYFAIQNAKPRKGLGRTVPTDDGKIPDCFCSNTPDLSGNAPFVQVSEEFCAPEQCYAKPDENAQHPCGRKDHNAVYQRFSMPNGVESYVGCYKDRSNPGGTLQFHPAPTGRNGAAPGSGGLFVGNCAAKCAGFKYFAIQDSSPRICTDRNSCTSDGQKAVCFCGDNPDLGELGLAGEFGRGPSAYDKLEDSGIGADTSCPSSACYSRQDREPCRNGVVNDACNMAGSPFTPASEQTSNIPEGGKNRPCGLAGHNAVYKLVESSVQGDPFTTYNGKKVQFYMPIGEETKLLTCGSYELIGRVMASGIPGDAQQWFDKFRVRVAGREAVVVDLRDTATLLPTGDDGAGASVVDEADVVVPSAEQRAKAALAQARRANATGTGQKLTTLRVEADGAAVPATGSLFTSLTRVWNGESTTRALNVTVTRDATRQIGNGFVEILDIVSDDISMQIQSSLATKFTNEVDRVKKMHMDMSFPSINAEACTGVLAEMWGVQPMSQQTARFLEPQQ